MEGLITCTIVAISYIFIVPFPDDKNAHKCWKFLTKPELDYVLRKLIQDRGAGDVDAEPFSVKRFFSGGKDVKVYLLGSVLGLTAVVTYSLAFFLPLIIHQKKLTFMEPGL
ncbi:hypothetical protein AA313_de0200023 [Arthrobotrys entomopaga]|nr:hypothetical protein AA313_de0200023 [Arthrobotrys entomopaga]